MASQNKIENASLIINRYFDKKGRLYSKVNVPCGILDIYLKPEDYKKLGVRNYEDELNYLLPVEGRDQILNALKKNIQQNSFYNSYKRAGLNNHDHPFNELYSIAIQSNSCWNSLAQIQAIKVLADLENQQLLDERIAREQPIAIRKIA